MNTQALPASMAGLTDVDPYPFYEAVRAKGPLVWDDSMRGFLVTSYELCRDIEMHEELYRHPYADASPELVEIKSVKGGHRNITVSQGEDHTKIHKWLLGLFVPRTVEQYRGQHIRPIITGLIDRFVDKGKIELTAAYSDQIPPRVLMSLFAMPWDDEALARKVLALHDDVMTWIGSQNRDSALTSRARAAGQEINAILMPYMLERKQNPGNDLISRLWTDGPKILDNFTDEDALANAREMFLAGTDTSLHALANAFHIILTQPAVMEAVRADRQRALSNLVEEALRLYGSVQYRFRVANQDCEIGGVSVKKNQVLILINSAANRDPAKYGCPAAVDLARNMPKEHLAFNAGPRTCIGAALARAEMIDGIGMLLDRVKNLRLDPAAPQPAFRFHYTRSFRPLHVLFDPA